VGGKNIFNFLSERKKGERGVEEWMEEYKNGNSGEGEKESNF
jgi:hypothetical protein